MSSKKVNSNLREIGSTKKTLHKMSKNSKIIYINENGRCRIVRQYLKKRTKDIGNFLAVNMEKECHNHQQKANNSQLLTELNKNILEKLKNQRNHTEAVAQLTLTRCKLLCQQIEQSVKHAEELRLTENSMRTLLQELKT